MEETGRSPVKPGTDSAYALSVFHIYRKRQEIYIHGRGSGMKGKNHIYMIWFYLFLGSFFLGVFLMNMGNETLLTEEGIFSAASVSRLKYIEIDNGRFLRYVLRQRMGEGIGLILLSATGIGLTAVYVWVIWQGLLAGMTITAAIIRFGMKGLLLLLGSLFPHQLLIIPAEVMLLGWCYENISRGQRLGGYTSTFYTGKKQQFLRQGISLLWILIVILIGCILESYVNPMLLSDIVKIF